jgi:hypothetical protein
VDGLDRTGTPVRTDSPSRGKRVNGGNVLFEPPEFRKRPYSPQLKQVASKPGDSGDFITFDPAPRSTTPARTGRRLLAPTRSYDVITGQPLF